MQSKGEVPVQMVGSWMLKEQLSAYSYRGRTQANGTDWE